MYDIKNMTIWKKEEPKTDKMEKYESADITELNLSHRSYNCLKRAGCSRIRDILFLIKEDEHGLLKIRNLGQTSEKEILEKMKEYEKECLAYTPDKQATKRTLIKPAKKTWNMSIDAIQLSQQSKIHLQQCGIHQIKDLYYTKLKQEPGWYSVRELFEILLE